MKGAPCVNEESLKERGFAIEDIEKINQAMTSAFEIKLFSMSGLWVRRHLAGWDLLNRNIMIQISIC